jgi:hypothetical protein
MPRKSKRIRYSKKIKKIKSKKIRKSKIRKNRCCIKCHNKHCSCKNKRHGGSGPIGGLEIKGGNCNPLAGSQYSVDKGGNYYGLPDNKAYSVDRNIMIRGGSIIPDNLLNVGRQISYGAKSLYNGLGGFEAPVNPSPYVQTKI